MIMNLARGAVLLWLCWFLGVVLDMIVEIATTDIYVPETEEELLEYARLHPESRQAVEDRLHARRRAERIYQMREENLARLQRLEEE